MSMIFVLGCIDTQVNPSHEENQLMSQPEVDDEVIDATPQYYRDEAWVCHHPGTEMHDKECIEETYPNGCYVEGDNSVFCWLLMKPECERPEKYPSAQKVCHLLRR